MNNKYLIGSVCIFEEECGEFVMEYYLVEDRDLFSIEIVKEPAGSYGSGGDAEIATSFPISKTRSVVERIAEVFMSNCVTPMALLECLDDIYEI